MDMSRDQIEAVVRAFMHEVSGTDPERIRSSRHLLEYGIDSVRAVDLAGMLEDRFHIAIPDEVLMRLRSLDDVVSYLAPYVATGAATTGAATAGNGGTR